MMDAALTRRRNGGYPDTLDSAALGRNWRSARHLQWAGTTIVTAVDIYLPDKVESSYPG